MVHYIIQNKLGLTFMLIGAVVIGGLLRQSVREAEKVIDDLLDDHDDYCDQGGWPYVPESSSIQTPA